MVRRHPGVSDPEGQSATHALGLLDIPLSTDDAIETYRAFRLQDGSAPSDFLERGSRALANLVIETATLGTDPLTLHSSQEERPSARRDIPILKLGDSDLENVSREMSLALTLDEMKAIQAFYKTEGRDPSDVELETLAQTWSEHCKHKTLTGPVELFVDGEKTRTYSNLLKETVFAATMKLSPEWCWSVFKDNAGVIALTEDNGIAIKVETHNHPSALDPYGGAGTGIGGVIRDILGTGLGARPFAATDVFCVGESSISRKDLPAGTMHPDRILDGVIAGVRDYGNRMGIPTVSGTVIRHPGYVANPLVFAGCVGEIPRDFVEKAAQPGDAIVAIGGRTGRDGVHGATFSSEALHEESETLDAAAVQIGDPITEKKVLDVLMLARDQKLFTALTDCGAGGFSSAVGEMGEDCGADVELANAPLKYPGLAYWEVWISEAQERMVLGIPPKNLSAFECLCIEHDVEMVNLGNFTDSQRLRLTWHGEEVCDLPMEFLHGGVPQPIRRAESLSPPSNPTPWPTETNLESLLMDALAHSSVASKEWVVRQYDHEVQGGTVVKPYQGFNGHGPGDGTVLKPNLSRPEGVALGCGIAPRISELDPWAGAACAIDEAIRNVVAAGGTPHQTAILDNFCWGDCRKPDRFGSLVLAAEACYEASLAYGAPFISGKDSLNNEYRVDGIEHPIPPTLLCTAVAPVFDCDCTTTTPLKAAGNVLVLVGWTCPDAGASVASDLLGLSDSKTPRPDFATASDNFSRMYEAIQSGSVVACHDLCEGGLGIAAAEMAMGSKLGARLELSKVSCDPGLPVAARLFSETPTRFLCEVPPDRLDEFLSFFHGSPCSPIGEVLPQPQLDVCFESSLLFSVQTSAILQANTVQ
jgi:phosphoribosylformylglycinamidine synthase